MSDVKWTPGAVVWRELMSSDLEKSKGFYGELFGWSFQDFDMGPGGAYPMIKAGEHTIGGLSKMPPGAAFPPHWASYVSVPDVDKACAAAKANGGKVTFGPENVPDTGRLATMLDFAGAAFAVIHSSRGDGDLPARPPVGTFCWETLTTTDPTRAKAFYAAVCGWKPTAGPDPSMLVFAAESGKSVADVQTAQGGMPASWLTYVVVAKHDAARDRAVKLGGTVVVPRIDVPKVGVFAIVADPSGAVIGLFEDGAQS